MSTNRISPVPWHYRRIRRVRFVTADRRAHGRCSRATTARVTVFIEVQFGYFCGLALTPVV